MVDKTKKIVPSFFVLTSFPKWARESQNPKTWQWMLKQSSPGSPFK
ncbi:hypothetical protein ACMZ6Z_06530 [Streptococcus pluranimalium]